MQEKLSSIIQILPNQVKAITLLTSFSGSNWKVWETPSLDRYHLYETVAQFTCTAVNSIILWCIVNKNVISFAKFESQWWQSYTVDNQIQRDNYVSGESAIILQHTFIHVISLEDNYFFRVFSTLFHNKLFLASHLTFLFGSVYIDLYVGL